MRLLSLKLKNFKGVSALTFSPDGGNASIYGDNGTGKTTVADSISWLLFDKDSKGNSKFDIKTQDAAGQQIHNLEHVVEGVFDTITLKKTYKETWTKKRGSNTQEFTGHTTDYEVDGVPVQKKEYRARVAGIAPEEMFRLLTTPNYFPETMPWQQRRTILMEVCGDVSDADVVAGSKELQPLAAIMATRKLDDHKKVVAASMKKINDEIKLIPARIDEASRAIVAEDIDQGVEEFALSQLQEKKAAADADYARAEAGQDGDQKNEIARIDARLLEIETECGRDRQKLIDAVDLEARSARNALRDIEDQIARGQKAFDILKAANIGASVDEHVAGLNAQMATLREEWAKVDSEVYTVGDCPTCGQLMPETEGAEEAFNQRKAERLEKINQDGLRLKGEAAKAIEAKEQNIADHNAEVAEGEKILGQLAKTARDMRATVAKYAEQIEKINAPAEPSAEAKALQLKRMGLAAMVAAGDNTAALDGIKEKIAGINTEMSAARGRIEQAKGKEKAQARVAELSAEEKRLAGEWERLSGELYLMEQFTRRKVELLEDKVNSKFELARFRLFQEQINGGLSECCEVLCGGVPYSTGLNNGARVNVGLDIIRTLSKHYGIELPVIVDNSESVTKLLPMDCQVIRLVVSEADKTLRVEKE